MPDDPDTINRDVVERMLEAYRRELPLLPGAEAAVRRAAAAFPLALASSSNREVFEDVLELAGLADCFRATVSSEEVARGKPAPDVYLEAARRLGVAPARCAAVEDSHAGIRSAKSAGMRVVAIPNASYPPDEETLELADAVVGSLDELTVDSAARLEQAARRARRRQRIPGAIEGSKSSRNMVKIVTSRSGPPSRAGRRRRSVASSTKPSLRGTPKLAWLRGSIRISIRSDPADLEADPRQRGRRLGHDPLPRRARAHPVADLEPARPDARMKPGAAEQLGLVGGEDPVREVLAGVEAGAEELDELDLLLERLRLVERPRHPRLQVLEARVDRLLQQRRVARLVAADDEPLRLDPVRSGRALPAHATRPTRTQPLCPPRPIAFERATSTCASRASFGT